MSGIRTSLIRQVGRGLTVMCGTLRHHVRIIMPWLMRLNASIAPNLLEPSSRTLPIGKMVEAAKLELVDVGTPVAVKTPVGIVVVDEPLPFDVDDEAAAEVGGALIITLEGTCVGCPARLVTLLAGVCQLAELLYNTPLIMTPARFATIFF